MVYSPKNEYEKCVGVRNKRVLREGILCRVAGRKVGDVLDLASCAYVSGGVGDNKTVLGSLEKPLLSFLLLLLLPLLTLVVG